MSQFPGSELSPELRPGNVRSSGRGQRVVCGERLDVTSGKSFTVKIGFGNDLFDPPRGGSL